MKNELCLNTALASKRLKWKEAHKELHAKVLIAE